MLWPAFVDAHTHLCKTHAVPRCRNPSGSINDALACEVTDQPRWSSPDVGAGRDIERRMDFALRSCLHHGTRAVRTHLDGVNAEDEALRSLVYAASTPREPGTRPSASRSRASPTSTSRSTPPS